MGSAAALLTAAVIAGCQDDSTDRHASPVGATSSEALSPAPGDPDRSIQIVLDGQFGDWEPHTPALIDPVDAPADELDFGAVHVISDEQFVYLSIETRREINVQRLNGSLLLIFDADGSSQTGESIHGLDGTDAIIQFSPPHRTRPEALHMGVRLTSPTHADDDFDESTWLNIYDTGFFFAPTYANDVIECRIDRGTQLPDTPPLFAGRSMAVKLVALDRDGNVRDQTDTIVHVLDRGPGSAPAITPQLTDPLVKSPGAMRVLTWNVQRGAMLAEPAPFRRMMVALNPEVILLQEIPNDVTVAQLRGALAGSQIAGDERTWHVQIGAGGGDLRGAVASRLPLTPVDELSLIRYPGEPDRSLRALGAIVEDHGRRILLISVHMKCCGRIGSREDGTRLEEVELLSEALRRALGDEDIDAVVIGGDLNLVGGYEPLARLSLPLSADLGRMSPLDAARLDGRSNVTWADPDEPFVPGRLDFLLLSDATLAAARSFVFDSMDLNDQWRREHGLERRDAAAVSDHRPVVADLRWVDDSEATSDNE